MGELDDKQALPYEAEVADRDEDANERYRLDSRHREAEDQAAGVRTFHPLAPSELEQRRLRRSVRPPSDTKDAA